MGIHNIIQTEEAHSRPHWREAISGRFFTQGYSCLTDMVQFSSTKGNCSVYLTSASVFVDT